jgi:hypothetical protein
MEEQFNIYANIVNTRLKDLIQIYITERKNNGIGMLFINFTNKEKMDVFYNPLYDKENECINSQFPEDLSKCLTENNKPPSIIYFNIFDANGNFLMEVDLDKRNF